MDKVTLAFENAIPACVAAIIIASRATRSDGLSHAVRKWRVMEPSEASEKGQDLGRVNGAPNKQALEAEVPAHSWPLIGSAPSDAHTTWHGDGGDCGDGGGGRHSCERERLAL